MAIVNLNKRQKETVYALVSKRTGRSMMQLTRRLRELFDMDHLAEIQEKNLDVMIKLIQGGKLKEGQAVSRQQAREYGMTVHEWDADPDSIEIDRGILETVRTAFKAEVDKEGDGAPKGEDFRLLDILDELDRAWDDSKAATKKLAKQLKEV